MMRPFVFYSFRGSLIIFFVYFSNCFNIYIELNANVLHDYA
ncbi:BnaAnng41840D [Brassica napus]|uniref:BnaAnng41840D protein n=1 Tax=Brassica napus TaxID=3708 RepID=A0A078K141_BRANA|nr:BnaAnng41840D [Brassica napus]